MRIVKSADERKGEILDVAEQLFAEKGFDNASTNDIIKKIGIARGTLYHHFKSKEEILDAIVERMMNDSIARARAIIKDKTIPIFELLVISLAVTFIIVIVLIKVTSKNSKYSYSLNDKINGATLSIVCDYDKFVE